MQISNKLSLNQYCKKTCRSGNLGISANISIRAAPFLLNAKYSTALCCISTSIELSYLNMSKRVRRTYGLMKNYRKNHSNMKLNTEEVNLTS